MILGIQEDTYIGHDIRTDIIDMRMENDERNKLENQLRILKATQDYHIILT